MASITCTENDVLLCNSGSTSLKLQVRGLLDETPVSSLHVSGSAQHLCDRLASVLAATPAPRLIAHRIVHAGLVTEQAQRIDDALLQQISHWSVLAPLHNPLALSLIAQVRQRWPQLPQYAIFDSGLYAQLPAVASHYALPASLSPRWPLRRYGFHGLAHRNQWRQVRAISQDFGLLPPRRMISLHLGGGCSLSAWQGERVIDTSMGFTPLEGLVMATRSGSIDPGIVLHLLQQEGMSLAQVNELISAQSGLASVDGGDGDMRALLAADTPQARQLLELYCYQLRRHIGAAVAVLGGLDAISIGGGVGEHQALIREQVLGRLEVFGVALDPAQNTAAEGLAALHTTASRVKLWLTPVNEFDEMFRQCVPLLAKEVERVT